MSKITKRQAFERVVSDAVSYLHRRGIVDEKIVFELRKQYGVTTDRLAANLEKWAMPPHKSGEMKAYVSAELEKTQLFAHKLYTGFSDDPVKQEQMKKVAAKVKTMNAEDVEFITKTLTRLCTILSLQT